jgi:hypothetical protein
VSHICTAMHKIHQEGSGIMPKDYTRILIEWMWTSSCDKFNEAFRHMQNAADMTKHWKSLLMYNTPILIRFWKQLKISMVSWCHYNSEMLLLLKVVHDKICMMTTRLACNWAIESSYWRMDNDSDVGLLTGYVLYRLPVELEFMDLDTFPRWFGLRPSLLISW